MDIKWFDIKFNEGQASINENSITLNTVAMKPFEHAYRVKVGMDDCSNLILKPITKDHVSRFNLNEDDYLGVQLSKTYARINSRELISAISKSLNLNFGKENLKFSTRYDGKENYLVINTGKGDKK